MINTAVADVKSEFDKQIGLVGEKFNQMIENGAFSRGIKKGVYGTALISGGVEAIALLASAVQAGAIGLGIGVVGLEAMLHKVWEKYFTRYSHGNVIEYSSEVMYFLVKFASNNNVALSDLRPHEFKALYDQAVVAVEELRRKKEFNYQSR